MANFRRTRISFDVLSEEPIHPHMDLEAVVRECDTGSFVMADLERTDETLTGKEMADALTSAGSNPDFFFLTEDGELQEEAEN